MHAYTYNNHFTKTIDKPILHECSNKCYLIMISKTNLIVEETLLHVKDHLWKYFLYMTINFLVLNNDASSSLKLEKWCFNFTRGNFYQLSIMLRTSPFTLYFIVDSFSFLISITCESCMHLLHTFLIENWEEIMILQVATSYRNQVALVVSQLMSVCLLYTSFNMNGVSIWNCISCMYCRQL